MKFEPKTEQQLQEENLLPEGEYTVEVFEAEDTTSSKGNDMIALKLRVFRENGSTWIVNDYLLEAMAFKLRHFCDAAGLMDKYDAGTLTAEDCNGKNLTAHIIIDKAKGPYRAKNSVKDYVKGEPSKVAKADTDDDDLPF